MSNLMDDYTFVEELKWRGMLHDCTPGVEEHLSAAMRRAYIGFDPTARSLTIGNYVQIMILTLFQNAGHQPIVLMGGATGRIGDPSGKDVERELKSFDELDENLRRQKAQFEHLLNFTEGDNRAIMLNNMDFYSDMNVLDFLREVGKNLTISYMLSKESVKKRLEGGLSYTEFSYLVLQAYDFLNLYRDENCTMQMGGSDQWGNITSGIEFVRRNTKDGKVYAITTPLLTKTDGSKFGKSEAGNIWLDPEMTSPYRFYQFWINVDDRDLPRFLRFFSLKPRNEIEAMEAMISTDARAVKQQLGKELTVRVHSKEAFDNVLQVSQILFNPKSDHEAVKAMTEEAFGMISNEIPTFEVSSGVLQEGISIIDLLSTHTTICQSKGEARRSIQSNAVSINKTKVSSVEHMLTEQTFVYNKFLLIENGKKNKFVIRVQDA